MSKKKKELSETELEHLNEEFSQILADSIYESIEKLGSKYHKKYDYDSVVSTFNVLLSISANCAIELGISLEDFLEVSKDFWKNAEKIIGQETSQEMLQSSSWLEPSTKDPKKLS